MAARYWVGGSGDWAALSTDHWSDTSGGVSGASEPTLADDVYFDANSGGGIVNVSGRPCKTLTTTGFSGTLTGTSILVYGAVLIAPETTISLSSTITFRASGSISAANADFSINLSPASGNIVVDLLSDITFAAEKSLRVSGASAKSATFNTNNHNLTFSGDALCIQAGLSTYTGIINLGSSIVSVESTVPFIKGTNGVFNCGTSKIQFRNALNSITLPAIQFFDIEFIAESAIIEFMDANINCHSIKFKAGCVYAVHGESVAGLTITANAVDAVGTSGSLITLSGFSTDKKLTFSVSSGTVTCDYLSLTNSVATGGATFNAGANSIDNGGNTGWIFGSAPSGYVNTVAGIAASNIASIAGVAKANIAKVGGV